MAIEYKVYTDGAWVAAADYSAKQFYAVTVSTSADNTAVLGASTGAQILGVIQNKPKSGEAVEVAVFGTTKAVSSGTITRGDPIMAYSDGTFRTWTAGSSYAQIGWARESAASGQIFALVLSGPASPKVLT